MTIYQVHVHANNGKHGVATFESMTEAVLYLHATVTDLLLFLPDADCVWMDDDHVQFISMVDGRAFATAYLVMHNETVH